MPREDYLTGKRVEPRQAIADQTRQWVTLIGRLYQNPHQ